MASRIAACILVGTVHACLWKSVPGGLATCRTEGKTLAEVSTSDSHVGREGDPLGGCEVLPTEPEGRVENESELFALGQRVDCKQDSAPGEMPRLRSASCVCVRVMAVRRFIQFPSTCYSFCASTWQGAPQLPCALAQDPTVLNKLVHVRGDNTVCPSWFNVSFLLRVSKGRGALYGWASHSPHHRWEMLGPGHGEH